MLSGSWDQELDDYVTAGEAAQMAQDKAEIFADYVREGDWLALAKEILVHETLPPSAALAEAA